MKLKITHRTSSEILNQSTEDTLLTNLKEVNPSDLHQSLSWLDAYPLQNTALKRIFIYYMFLKDSKIPVKISDKGTFFYIGEDGSEHVFEQPTYELNNLGIDALNEVLRNLDYRLVEVELIS